jgi:hypothetical protein
MGAPEHMRAHCQPMPGRIGPVAPGSVVIETKAVVISYGFDAATLAMAEAVKAKGGWHHSPVKAMIQTAARPKRAAPSSCAPSRSSNRRAAA